MYAYGGKDEGLDSYMTNTSKVPIFRSQDLEPFPRFLEKVVPIAQEAVLTPGDLLVMPPGWWHAMRGEGTGPGWSVSMWY
jgi:ribosomal protein L16 Arg81 hydroxylase